MLLTRCNGRVEITIGNILYRGFLRHRQGIIGEGYIHFEGGQSVVCRLVLEELSRLCGRDIRTHPLFSNTEGFWPYGDVNKQLDCIEEIIEISSLYNILTKEELQRLNKYNENR
ncbi:MAG: hypothetical protein IPJ51_10620 [Saprospiraceae bacterium]|nr:hypothetical protein [Saprospiraceae bacterium]